jgi:hypothetical protein
VRFMNKNTKIFPSTLKNAGVVVVVNY